MLAVNKKNNILSLLLFSLLFSSCSKDLSPNQEAEAPLSRDQARKRDFGQFFGTDFLMFGGPKKQPVSGALSPQVNGFLWQAALDVLSFLPFCSADAVGGIIVSDWYSTPDLPQERTKVRVEILDRVLTSHALKVSVHRQVHTKNGSWVNVHVTPALIEDLGNIILSKARELRVKSLNG